MASLTLTTLVPQKFLLGLLDYFYHHFWNLKEGYINVIIDFTKYTLPPKINVYLSI